MDGNERSRMIERYRAGADAVMDAASSLTDAELDRAPDDGGWSARQVVHHLAESEIMSAVRLRRLLAEDGPAIHAYDEEEYARVLHYDRPVGAALEAFRAARLLTAELLDRLGDDDWSRAGTHPEHGSYSVDDWLVIYADHAFDHVDQLRRAAGDAARGAPAPVATS